MPDYKKKRQTKISTRDAVESAIDMSKGNKQDTWEKVIAAQPKDRSRWDNSDNITRKEFMEILEKASRPKRGS